MRPGSQTANPAQAVYPPNQPIMMTMTAMPFHYTEMKQKLKPKFKLEPGDREVTTKYNKCKLKQN